MFSDSASGQFRRFFGIAGFSEAGSGATLCAVLLLLAGVLFPANGLLLHAGAVVAAVWIIVCIWRRVLRAISGNWIAVLYLLAWLVFYWLTAWKR